MKRIGRVLCIFSTLLALAAPQVFGQDRVQLIGAGIPSIREAYLTTPGALRLGSAFASLDYIVTSPDDSLGRVINKTSDFAVTDFALLQRDLAHEKLLQFPVMATAIVPVVNLPGIASDQLKLTGAVLADIMSGKIDSWNSSKIRALNPGLALPSLPINRIVRSGATGATLVLTKYLSRHSKEFEQKIGSGRTVSWPDNPQKARDENDTAVALLATPGSIAYIEMPTGNRKQLSFVSLIHASGNVVKADISFLGAGVLSNELKELGVAESGALTVVDVGQNWPIVLPIYIVIRQVANDDNRARRMLQFFFLNFRKNDFYIEEKGFVSLPATLQMRAIRTFNMVRSKSGDPLKVVYDF